MVNVTKGILVECDPAMKQVLLSIHRDFNSNWVHFSFFCILMRSLLLAQNLSSRWQVLFPVNRQKNICFQDLDETHLFISPDVLEQLKAQIDDLMDKISVPIVEGVEKKWKLKRNLELGPSTRWRYRKLFWGWLQKVNCAEMIRRTPTRIELRIEDISE